jgi:unsaturated rhamnogalacturonyl hydrolase
MIRQDALKRKIAVIFGLFIFILFFFCCKLNKKSDNYGETGMVFSNGSGSSSSKNFNDTIGVQVANYIISTWPDINSLTSKGWEYTNGIILYGIIKIYEKTGDRKYYDYVKAFVDKYANDTNTAATHNLDVVQPSMLLFTLYDESKDIKYLNYMTNTRNSFSSFSKNPDGGFFHKSSYPNQMWLDGIYMAQPFIVRFGSRYGSLEDKTFGNDTSAFQIKLITKHTLDPAKKLLFHGWDYSKSASWANPATGVSPEIWSRGLGWYMMALVDVLDFLPQSHSEYKRVISDLNTIAEGLKNNQDSNTGLWFQVVDKGNLTDNWNETSGSAMFVYALKKAVQKGYLPLSYNAVTYKGWNGLKTKIQITPTNTVTIAGSVQAMGIQKNYASYVTQSQVNNAPHALAGVLMASSVIEF